MFFLRQKYFAVWSSIVILVQALDTPEDVSEMMAALNKAATDIDRVVKAVEKQKDRVSSLDVKSSQLERLLEDSVQCNIINRFSNTICV